MVAPKGKHPPRDENIVHSRNPIVEQISTKDKSIVETLFFLTIWVDQIAMKLFVDGNRISSERWTTKEVRPPCEKSVDADTTAVYKHLTI